MAPQFDRPLPDLLTQAGCALIRQGIPSRHTANAILRQAGLPMAF
jgi:hypothetical protein